MPDESSSSSSESSESSESSSSSSIIIIDPPLGSSSSGSSSSSGTGGGSTGSGRRRNPALPNQAILDELTKAENICHKAEKVDYAALLAEREITAGFIAAALVKIQEARAKSALATDMTTDKFGMTDHEQETKTALLACLSEIQTAAKQKFRLLPARLQDYYIGERIDQNRARLEQLGEQMIAKAASDVLPGIKPAKITAANTALADYKASQGGQSDAQSHATGSRGSLKTMMKEITNTRITIQLAADAEWPHDNPENAAVRREFKLPVNLKFKG